jgi:alcohol dehydrogenase (NADP+)
MKAALLLPLAAGLVAAQPHLAFEQPEDGQVPLFPGDAANPEPLTIDAIPLIGFGTWNLKTNCTELVSWAMYAHVIFV